MTKDVARGAAMGLGAGLVTGTVLGVLYWLWFHPVAAGLCGALTGAGTVLVVNALHARLGAPPMAQKGMALGVFAVMGAVVAVALHLQEAKGEIIMDLARQFLVWFRVAQAGMWPGIALGALLGQALHGQTEEKGS